MVVDKLVNRTGILFGGMHSTLRNCRLKPFGAAWCDPSKINLATQYYEPKHTAYLLNGRDLDRASIKWQVFSFIATGNWDQRVVDLCDNSIIRRAYDRFLLGKSWDEIGEIDWLRSNINYHGSQDGCTSEADITDRLNNLDSLYATLQSERKFKLQKELNKKAFRERGGICVAIGRKGDLIWMGDGAHRLTIAKIIGLKLIPVAIILVHSMAIQNNHYLKNITLNEGS